MKLKYRLEKWECALVFQVLEMDERFRNESDVHQNEFYTSSGFRVMSSSHPSIHEEKIFLMGGNRKFDNTISIVELADNQDRDKLFNRIQQALREWANLCKELKDDHDPKTGDYPNIYIL